MIVNPFPVLKTDRLILRCLHKQDRLAMFEYHSNKGNFPFVAMPIYQDISEVDAYIERLLQGVMDQKWLVWAITYKTELIGTISLWNFNEARDRAEFGYGIFPAFREKGFMKEAIKACESFGKDILNLSSIEAYTGSVNKPSKGLLEALDYVFNETIVESGVSMDIYKKSLSH